MAGYKVSYKVLKKQGEELKSIAKLLDGYAEKISQTSGRLGEGDMLAEVRKNLQKLKEQLGESRAVLNTVSSLLDKTVESYGVAETKRVKKIDGMKAHNRDFYKRPVVVASVIGTAAGAAAGAPSASGATTVNYTDNSVNSVTVFSLSEGGAAELPSDPPSVVGAAPGSQAAPSAQSAAPGLASLGASVSAGALGGAGAVAAAAGALRLKKKRDAAASAKADDYDPEAALEEARRRVAALSDEGDAPESPASGS